MTAQLVTDALVTAIWNGGRPDALLHYSDQDSQYTGEQFQKLLDDNGVNCSMSRLEKIKRLSRKKYQTRDQGRANIFDYIEHFYNVVRRYSALGYSALLSSRNRRH